MDTAAEEIIAKVRARNAREEQPVALCAMGEQLSHRGQIDEALACFDAALRLKAGLARGWVGRATILMRQARGPEALACIHRALEMEPGFPPALLLEGNVLQKRGAREKALACYEGATAGDPHLVDAWLASATVLYEFGRMSDAMIAVERFVALAPDDHPELLTAEMMARELARSGAKPSFRPAAVPPPAPVEAAHVSRPGSATEAQPSRRSSRTIQAINAAIPRASDAVATGPVRRASSPSAPRVKAAHASDDATTFADIKALHLENRQVEALRKLEPIVKRCPESVEAWRLRAQILFALTQLEPALQSVEKALRLAPSDVDLARLHVNVLSKAKKDERALVAADRVVELVPEDAEAHRTRGDCLLVLMRPKDALPSYEKLVHLRPEDASAWVALGRTHRQLRRFAAARVALSKAIAVAEGAAPDAAMQARDFLARLPVE